MDPVYRGKHKVLNHKTGRYVLKTGAIGKSLSKSKCSFKTGRKKKDCKSVINKSVNKSSKKVKSTKKKAPVRKSPTKIVRKTVRKSPKKTVRTKKTVRKSSTGAKYKSASGRVYTKCWSGYKRAGWKMKNGRRVPNCVKA